MWKGKGRESAITSAPATQRDKTLTTCARRPSLLCIAVFQLPTFYRLAALPPWSAGLRAERHLAPRPFRGAIRHYYCGHGSNTIVASADLLGASKTMRLPTDFSATTGHECGKGDIQARCSRQRASSMAGAQQAGLYTFGGRVVLHSLYSSRSVVRFGRDFGVLSTWMSPHAV